MGCPERWFYTGGTCEGFQERLDLDCLMGKADDPVQDYRETVCKPWESLPEEHLHVSIPSSQENCEEISFHCLSYPACASSRFPCCDSNI